MVIRRKGAFNSTSVELDIDEFQVKAPLRLFLFILFYRSINIQKQRENFQILIWIERSTVAKHQGQSKANVS